MKLWKAKIGLIDRIYFAWKAFWLQSYSKTFPFLMYESRLEQKYFACDIGGIGKDEGCTNNSLHCLSRPTVKIIIETEDHYHVCDDHNKDRDWFKPDISASPLEAYAKMIMGIGKE
jgi:hypothetical protein